MKFMERTIGNLGEDLDTILDHDSESIKATSGTDDSFPLVDMGRSQQISRVWSLLFAAARGRG